MLKTAFILFLLLASGCKDQYTPKPYGYFRIDFPEKQWVASPDTLPYCFEQSAQAILDNDTALNHYLEDCHHLAYTHTIKAESINEKYFKNREIFGLIYYIEGNTASSTQFFITDSTRHFLRGALYFNQHPDKDSLAPVIDYLREDIVTLMETLRFKNK